MRRSFSPVGYAKIEMPAFPGGMQLDMKGLEIGGLTGEKGMRYY